MKRIQNERIWIGSKSITHKMPQSDIALMEAYELL